MSLTFGPFEVSAKEERQDSATDIKKGVEVDYRALTVTAYHPKDIKRVAKAIQGQPVKVDLMAIAADRDSKLFDVAQKTDGTWTENHRSDRLRKVVALPEVAERVLPELNKIPDDDKIRGVRFIFSHPEDVAKVADFVKKAGGVVKEGLPKVEDIVRTAKTIPEKIKQDVKSGQQTIESGENTLHNINNDIHDAPSEAGHDIGSAIVGGLSTAGHAIESGFEDAFSWL
ncbi:MAG: hypothetical protein JSS34_06270 [Proteobacteria bacterium]|nr:hypothetical protein [Pseudomonadota bacterium]